MTTPHPHYVFAPAPQPFLTIFGSEQLFPLRRVFCVGRNYAAHAREMGADPSREPPFFFCKPTDGVVPALRTGATVIAYPPQTNDLHHEVEMVVAIGKAGAAIEPTQALNHVWGYGLGLDLTRRDIQAGLKAKDHPWEMGKAFDQCAPVSALTPVSTAGHPARGVLRLEVNGIVRQEGDLADMIWSVAETIAHLSRYVALAPGDLIFTGTPEGVGPIVRGDELRGSLAGLAPLHVRIA